MKIDHIYNEDCLDTMARMEDGFLDLVITSPPYNIGGMHTNGKQHGTYANNDMPEKEYQDWQIKILNELFRVTKEGGSLFYNHKVRIKNGVAIHPLEWVLKSDWILKQEITWDMGGSANCDKIRFFPFSERIYWLVKNPKTKVQNDLRLSDIWRVVPTHKRGEIGHIAVMPDRIVENILSSIDADLVYDPFMGSGTTARVCVKMGRKFIGSEVSSDYCQVIEERLSSLIQYQPEEGTEQEAEPLTLFDLLNIEGQK